LESVQ